MFNINDYVVYKSMGVYKVVDIIKEELNDSETEYYVLQPAYNNNLTIKVPVNNTKILMRAISTKDEVLSLIEAMPMQETNWIDDYKKRSESFKAAFGTGESAELIKLIKTIYLEKQEKADHGKKIMRTDEDMMYAAEKNLYEEFAIALNITPVEVEAYIQNHVS